MAPNSESTPLQREIGAPLAITVYELGTMLGAAIYCIPGEVAGAASFLAFLAGGGLAPDSFLERKGRVGGE